MINGVPERWLAAPVWRCPAAHVSTRRARGRRARCVFCGSDVVPTFPGDRSGPLPMTNEWLDATRAGNSDVVLQQSRHAATDEKQPAGPQRIRDGWTPSSLFIPDTDLDHRR
jgi:hypothetical protein